MRNVNIKDIKPGANDLPADVNQFLDKINTIVYDGYDL